MTVKANGKTYTNDQIMAMRPWELKKVILAHPNGATCIRNYGRENGLYFALSFDGSGKLVDYITTRELPLMCEFVRNNKGRNLMTEQSTHVEPYYGINRGNRDGCYPITY
jgi:hypothetical protein